MLPSLVLACSLQLPVHAAPRSLDLPVTQAGTPLSELRVAPVPPRLVGDEVRAFGADWKARMGAGGLRFTPALGPDAPVSRPLRLVLESVERGGEALPAQPWSEPAVEGQRVGLARGAGILENFDVRAEGIELSIDVAQELGGQGDLVARYRWSSTLEPAQDFGLQPQLEFRCPQGGVRIGHVTGIDADGERVRGSIRLGRDSLDLILPADFVDAAAWPITIDPLIESISTLPLPELDTFLPDVSLARDQELALVVHSKVFSGVDLDVYGYLVPDGGFSEATLIGIETGDVALATTPKVTHVGPLNRWLVAWSEVETFFGPAEVRCCWVQAPDGQVSPSVAIEPSSNSQVEPALSGRGGASGTYATVVWRELGAGIKARGVSLGLDQPLPLNGQVVTSSPTAEMPAVSRCEGEYGQLLVGWADRIAAHDDRRDLWVRRFSQNLTQSSPGLRLTNSSSEDDRWPSIDGDGRQWMVASETEVEGGGPRITRRQRVRFEGGALDGSETAVELSGPRRPNIVYTGHSYAMVAYVPDLFSFAVGVYAWGSTGTGASQSGVLPTFDPQDLLDPPSLCSRTTRTSPRRRPDRPAPRSAARVPCTSETCSVRRHS